MIAVSIICAATVLLMIIAVLVFPEIKIKKISFGSYWVITLVGAVILLSGGLVDAEAVGKALIADSAVNPLKILVLFLSMTLLSVFLDELGFFAVLANAVLRRAHAGQKRLFLYVYLTVSVLTVFTSNDVIILSFTPFICYFAKNAEIDPVPYLAAEFVAANTWSMLFIIGNPTNIYLATAYGLDFVNYVVYSILPTLFAGTTAFCALYLLFRKRLAAPISHHEPECAKVGDKFLLWVGIVHLAVCTVLLAIGSYLGLEMWIVSLSCALSLALFALVYAAVRKKPPKALGGSLKRAPWQLVPFVLSMFVMIAALEGAGVTAAIGEALGGEYAPLKYGIASFFASNLVNNVPMSVLFSSVISAAQGGVAETIATVIGSNLGAFFTPLGALAGIMFTGILSSHNVKYTYLDFLKTGVIVALPTLFAALGGLYLTLLYA